MTHRLSSIDWAFLQAESPSNLAHVAGLWIFELPEGYRGNLWQDFMQGLDDPRTATEPFIYRVSSGIELPSWVPDADCDLDNHVRFSALPKPGSAAARWASGPSRWCCSSCPGSSTCAAIRLNGLT